MQGRLVTTLEHARNIVRHYRLDQFDWEGLGSPEGFADMLYRFEHKDDLETVCQLFKQYRQDCKKRSTAVVDAEFAQHTHERQAPVQARAAEFIRLAEFVRSVRFSEEGTSLWRLVAHLVTTHQPVEWFERFASEDEKRRLLPLLDGLLSFKSLHFECPAGYEPCVDGFFDHCLFHCVEQLDVMLERASPETHEEFDFCYELNALLALAGNVELRDAIAVAATSVPSRSRTVRALRSRSSSMRS